MRVALSNGESNGTVNNEVHYMSLKVCCRIGWFQDTDRFGSDGAEAVGRNLAVFDK